MVRILLYNNTTGRMERYNRDEAESMPYINNHTLTVKQFRGQSRSSVLWTDLRTMEAFSQTGASYGRPIYIGYAFRRIWEGGHSNQSQHYAGTAFDLGQNATHAERTALRETALALGLWGYVEPAPLSSAWVHLDRRGHPPACAASGYIMLRPGQGGHYVCVLQDALKALGFAIGLDGIFGAATVCALKAFQQKAGLTEDGIAGCNTWRALTRQANGIGKPLP